MLNVLFLDDDPLRTKALLARLPSAVCVEDAASCIEALNNRTWDFVFLDHDLGGEVYVDSSNKNTGMEVVRWLTQNKKQQPTLIVHTMNVPASFSMCDALKFADYEVIRAVFGSKPFWTYVAFVNEEHRNPTK